MKKLIKYLLKRSRETTFIPILIFIILFSITNVVAVVKLFSVVSTILDGSSSENHIIGDIIGIADFVLIGIVLYILANGIYDLFIYDSDINDLESGQFVSVKDIDELKERVAKLIIVILIIYVFKSILSINPQNNIDILYVSGSILLLSLSIKMISNK